MASPAPSIQFAQIKRVESLAAKTGADFFRKIFSTAERAYCEPKKNKWEHYSARYAAKIALLAACGYKSSPVPLSELEILHRKTGKPFFKLSQKIRRDLKISKSARVELSLAHERDYAVAIVLISG